MPKEKKRCAWAGDKALLISYNDNEWGIPVYDDQKHFEMLTLEGAQAGLNWETVLKKRHAYAKAFKKFDPKKIAKMTDQQLAALLENKDLIRNRLKINSARKNAQVFLAIQDEFGSFNNYVWKFVNNKIINNRWEKIEQIPTYSAESTALSKDLKKRGMSFVGKTIIYAYLQAVGMVNDHTLDCFQKYSGKKHENS